MLDSTFAALADPTRRGIVERLAVGPATVSAVAEPYGMTLPAVLKHLKVLESGGLVTRRKSGRTVTVTLRPDAIRDAATYLEGYRAFWESALDRMADLVQEEAEESR